MTAVFNGRIEKGSILVTDSLRAYQNVANDSEVTHVRILKVKYNYGSFNVEPINVDCSELKKAGSWQFQ
ncbi:hypothetical protein [Akkermansia muciniphila]|uniref:hypothetical protein n=1 Tax=Akkermansia muciniphila TaxID=239935 RepID=UPI0011AF9693|nr:hypothetical protein [Akkermansia muciniphila]